MPDFGVVLAGIVKAIGPVEAVLPAVSSLQDHIRARMADWTVQPRIILGEAEKLAAFRTARAALCASGTVTLELALAGVPMVVAYKVAALEAFLAHRLVTAASIVLPNLVLEQRLIPEFIQQDCTPATLLTAVLPLLADSAARERQLAGLALLDQRMRLGAGETPSGRAARIVLTLAMSRKTP